MGHLRLPHRLRRALPAMLLLVPAAGILATCGPGCAGSA